MFDAHCHLDLRHHEAHADWQKAQQKGLIGAILAGVNPLGWKDQEQLCAQYDGLKRTVGLHPWHVAQITENELPSQLDDLSQALVRGSSIVGIGETGLDRSQGLQRRGPLQFDLQVRAFEAQIHLAIVESLPLVLHVVRAQGRALEIIQTLGPVPKGGMVHSFSGSAESARNWLDLGFHISIPPRVRQSQAKRIQEVVKMVPLNRLLLETDSPDQAASPADLLSILEAVAHLRNTSVECIKTATTDNTHRLFGLIPITE